MSEAPPAAHRRVVIGVEIEAYSICQADYAIGRRTSRPRPGTSEAGERFTRDTSIGSEYNSRPFHTVREALFLLKLGLRKYLRDMYRGEVDAADRLIPLLVGGWTNRFAGTHLHISLDEHELTLDEAVSIAEHLHDHIPLLMAMGANSPVWDKRLTAVASNRVLRGGDSYFSALDRDGLTMQDLREMRYAPGRKTKPPTLELRVLDSNVPEMIVACLAVTKAIVLRWLRTREPVNVVAPAMYLEAREDAARRGMGCKLPWRDELVPARVAFDHFLWEHRAEIEMMDVPPEVFDTFKLIKRGFNGAKIIRSAVAAARERHAQTWQRRFAKRYSEGLELLLSGNHLRDFAGALHADLPQIDAVWLGRKSSSIDG
ncbi:MAG: hypothetical protein IAG13_13990 [Deltaproteobacteria bacterium]|nr:hypothetical protein [Nannocystaceae bacterium]